MAEETKMTEESQKEELTVEKLFEGYDGGSFDSELIAFEPIGNEKW